MKAPDQPGRRIVASFAAALIVILPAFIAHAGVRVWQAGAGRSVAVENDSWPMLGHDPGGTSFNGAERAIGPGTISRLHPAWTFPYATQAIAATNRVYAVAGGSPGGVVVLDAHSGRVLHRYGPKVLELTGTRISPIGDRVTVLAVSRRRLIVGTETGVLALNPDTGSRYWRVPGGAFDLTVAGGVVYAAKSGCQNPCGPMGTVAIDLLSGRVLWRHSRTADFGTAVIGGHLYMRAEQVVYRGSQPARSEVVHEYAPRTGGLRATWRVGFVGGLIGDRRGLYTSHGENASSQCRQWVSRVDWSGRPLWKLNTGGECSPLGGLVLTNDTLYVAAQKGGPGSTPPGRIVALDRWTGRVRWSSAVGACHTWYGECQTSNMIAANHLLFVGTAPTHRVEVLDEGTGRLLRRLSSGWPGGSLPVMVAGGTLYLGQLAAYTVSGSPPRILTPTPTPSPAPPVTPYPSALDLMRRSATVMAAVRKVHGEGRSRMGGAERQIRASWSGDCVVSRSARPIQRAIRAILHLTYVSFGNVAQRTAGTYIIIGTDRGGRAWKRSPSTGRRWREIRYDTSSLVIGTLQYRLCPRELSFLVMDSKYRRHLTNLGQTVIAGVNTWHLQDRTGDQVETTTWDVYVDEGSLRQIRVDLTNKARGGPAQQDRVEQSNYSSFDVPVHIAPPTLGGFRP